MKDCFKAADLLTPLYGAIARAVKGSAYNICDETYHKVLVNAEDNEGYGRHLPGSAS